MGQKEMPGETAT